MVEDEFSFEQETQEATSSATQELNQHKHPKQSDDDSTKEDGRVEEEMTSISRKINQPDNRYSRLDAAEGYKHIDTGDDVIEGIKRKSKEEKRDKG